MGKPAICVCENKDTDQLCSHAFVFATRIVQFLFYFNPMFQASCFFFVTVQASLCRTWLESKIIGFLMQRLILFIPYFYITKLGLMGIHIFLIFDLIHRLWVLTNVYLQSMF